MRNQKTNNNINKNKKQKNIATKRTEACARTFL